MSITTPIDLKEIYSLRKNFIVIGITGTTGAGCTEVAEFFQKGFPKDELDRQPLLPKSAENNEKLEKEYSNTDRKYRIVYNYAKENFKEFFLIEFKHVLTLFLIEHKLEALISYLKAEPLKEHFISSNLENRCNFSDEINELNKLESIWNTYHNKITNINEKLLKPHTRTKEDIAEIYKLFAENQFKDLSKSLHKALSLNFKVTRIKVLQLLANNIRKTGNPFSSDNPNPSKIFSLVDKIHLLIKAHKAHNNDTAQIVIDSLRNPLEVMYFKERYSAFYLLAVNKEAKLLKKDLEEAFQDECKDVIEITEEEYKKANVNEFYKQNVAACIQKADIHISFIDDKVDKFSRINENTEQNELKQVKGYDTDELSWKHQILKYISLILQPGIIPPSAEERCMQLAYVAKYNSGCISRQVGASITDKYYSIKAIGWNDTPAGQTPCVLRNASDLINGNDNTAFTEFEKNDAKFQKEFRDHYQNFVTTGEPNLFGKNICFCFKTIRNSYSEGKNQVHTRSLHAEENAFLQITKYGGQAIKDGVLFSTASPCELCSKKAYQLGIRVIYFIDPYPGISETHILKSSGDRSKDPEVRLFHGAIGAAYHSLYEPFMPYKDELSLLLGQNIQDLTKSLENDNKMLKKQKEVLAAENAALKLKVEIFEGNLNRIE